MQVWFLGIIAVVLAVIPFLGGIIAFPFIAVGLTLSAVAFDRARKEGGSKGKEIAGIVTNGVALAFTVLWITLFAVAEKDITIDTSALTWSVLQLV